MIQELVELSGRLPKGKLSHDALDYVPVSIDCVIDQKGSFKKFIVHDKQQTLAERIAAKKGKARLLVDKPEEVLGFFDEKEKDKKKREKSKQQAGFKHKLFRDKLNEYRDVKGLSPILSFYESNRKNGVEKALDAFASEVEEKERSGNIGFLLANGAKRIHEQNPIYEAIIGRFEEESGARLKNSRFDKCSICGSSSFPVVDFPHGMIKRVPAGQTSGCALISYNFNATESYGLRGNENSSVCTRCARAYVDAFNWLLSNGTSKLNDKGKEIFIYKNRKNISDDTAVVFWLRKSAETSLLDILDNPSEDAVRAMFDSVYDGRKTSTPKIERDTFYAITLSGTAARIAVRDWIETSLETLRENLAMWFRHIMVERYDPDHEKLVNHYPRFWELVKSMKSRGANDVQHGRIGAVLWKCAVMGQSPPLWLVSAVLNRIRAEQGNATPERRCTFEIVS